MKITVDRMDKQLDCCLRFLRRGLCARAAGWEGQCKYKFTAIVSDITSGVCWPKVLLGLSWANVYSPLLAGTGASLFVFIVLWPESIYTPRLILWNGSIRIMHDLQFVRRLCGTRLGLRGTRSASEHKADRRLASALMCIALDTCCGACKGC